MNDFPILLVEDSKHDVRIARRAWRVNRISNKLHVVPHGQACLDFLRNEGKYSDISPSHSSVEILLAENGKGGCILTITDEGQGIPPQYQENVFQRFFQACADAGSISQGYSRSYGGLGLGLTIARAFTRSEGGDVRILDSEQGCRMQMTLPPI